MKVVFRVYYSVQSVHVICREKLSHSIVLHFEARNVALGLVHPGPFWIRLGAPLASTPNSLQATMKIPSDKFRKKPRLDS